jgi:hypothetical protein
MQNATARLVADKPVESADALGVAGAENRNRDDAGDGEARRRGRVHGCGRTPQPRGGGLGVKHLARAHASCHGEETCPGPRILGFLCDQHAPRRSSCRLQSIVSSKNVCILTSDDRVVYIIVVL